jgi:2-methylcitrate dehydratase PrpD
VAAAIRYGKLDDPHLLDLEALMPLMARIDVRHEASFDAYAPEGRPGLVRIYFRDGSSAERQVIYPRGTPRTPATTDERRDKARVLLGRHYGAAHAENIIAAARALADGGSVAALTRALRRTA